MKMTIVKVSHVVNFACGCLCEYFVVGQFAGMKDWHVTSCREHHGCRPEVADAAQEALRKAES